MVLGIKVGEHLFSVFPRFFQAFFPESLIPIWYQQTITFIEFFKKLLDAVVGHSRMRGKKIGTSCLQYTVI